MLNVYDKYKYVCYKTEIHIWFVPKISIEHKYGCRLCYMKMFLWLISILKWWHGWVWCMNMNDGDEFSLPLSLSVLHLWMNGWMTEWMNSVKMIAFKFKNVVYSRTTWINLFVLIFLVLMRISLFLLTYFVVLFWFENDPPKTNSISLFDDRIKANNIIHLKYSFGKHFFNT